MAHRERESSSTAEIAEQDVKEIGSGSGPNQAKRVSTPLNSNGLTLQATAPKISGAEGGESTIHSASTDSQPAPAPVRPTLVQLGSSSTQPSFAPSAPHTKRLYTSNINKKFLEQNSNNNATANSSSSAATTIKPGTQTSRPAAQISTSHPRLVTTKLTATPPSSSTTGPGWSRPSSATPPVASGPSHSPNGTSPLATTGSSISTSQGAPQLPVVGRVIQPQPRSALPAGFATDKPNTGRPAWGNVKPPAAVNLALPDIQPPSDFPTAAEVAQASARKGKPQQPQHDLKTPSAQGTPTSAPASTISPSTSKSIRTEDADTFRGKHLDPHSHHWDEMVQEDDNFLDAPLEFDDGTQYKIEAKDLPPQPSESQNNVIKEDRFGDDFDRSWPRAAASPLSRDATLPSTSPRISSHSPQEPSSRALFNERSNRLEPYNGPKSGPYPKRGPYDAAPSPNDHRSPRDPLTSPSRSHFQLGSKAGSDFPSRSRRFSNDTSGPSPVDRRPRDKDKSYRRDSTIPGSMGPPPLPRDSHGFRLGSGRDRDFSTDPRGRGVARGASQDRAPLSSRESVRQLPPHLSHTPSPGSVSRRLPSQDSRHPSDNLSVKGSQHATQSPARSVAPPLPTIPPQLNGQDLDDVRKDVMHSAAERAKQRRQQEELEREKEKERARQKAAEIEQRMKAAQKAQEGDALKMTTQKDEVSEIIESAVSGAKPKIENALDQPRPIQSSPSAAKAQLTRPPSMRGTPRQPPSELPRAPPRRPAVPVLHHPSAEEATSWRSKVPRAPPPALTVAPASPQDKTRQVPFAEEQPTTDIAPVSGEDVEVVDFSDLGKVLAEGKTSEPTAAQTGVAQAPVSSEDSRIQSRKPIRPVASDFFDDKPAAEPKPESSSWRVPQSKVSPESKDDPADGHPAQREDPLSTPEKPHHPHAPHFPPHHHQQHPYPSQSTHRLPRAAYKDVSMSALDDAMSRIKGALNGMHSSEFKSSISSTTIKGDGDTHLQFRSTASSGYSKSTHRSRWAPSSHSPSKIVLETSEVFAVTASVPPTSPVPSKLNVSLPSVMPRDLVHHRQLYLFAKSASHRWDILSFDPPVEGMRRDLSLNEVLFRKSQGGFKGKPKIRLYLPGAQGASHAARHITPTQPKLNGAGAFGRPSNADASSWRRQERKEEQSLDTTNGTPNESPVSVPAPVPNAETADEVHGQDVPRKEESAPVRLRTQPKMPAGSAVAFYRDPHSRIDTAQVNPKVTVNFIVSSELDENPATDSTPAEIVTSTIKVEHPTVTITPPPVADDKEVSTIPTKEPVIADQPLEVSPTTEPPTPVRSKIDLEHRAEQRTDDPPVNDSPPKTTTPPAPNTLHTTPSRQNSWARSSVSLTLKDSPARGPDPEHLKAVWSQTSNKPGVPTVNSLEGIVDDPVPFTIPEVKSEDGETPPPTVSSSGPSRMSLHDVTRAFQQVPPTPSSSSSSHSHRTPAPLSASPARQASYNYSTPSNNMRPSYQPTFSPMMSHSPAPVMYPHPMSPAPVPNRITPNNHPSLYNQPTWVSMNAPGGPSPANPGMMRPVTSPYPAPMMGYPLPGPPGTQTIYGHPSNNTRNPSQRPSHPHNTPASQAQVNRNRAHNLPPPPMISPVIAPATAAPMYAGSPVMMQMQPHTASHSYVPLQGARGQARPDGNALAMHPHTPQTIHPSPHHVYNTPRPAW